MDDNQLSLAIGKKGQNVRLAAKLIGWKIDIKSEEEKRREVEVQMARLQVTGAPLSVLIDFGLPEKVIERLFEAGIGTVERLGSMTPEEIQAIPGITPLALESIQDSVNAYYGPYEDEVAAGGAPADVSAAPAAEGADAQEVAADVIDPAAETVPVTEPPVNADPVVEPEPEPVPAGEPVAEPEKEA